MIEIKKTLPKNHEVKLKYEKSELDKLKRKAEQLSLKVSQYIRMCSLNADIKVENKI